MSFTSTNLPNSTGDHLIVGITYNATGIMDQWFNYLRIENPATR